IPATGWALCGLALAILPTAARAQNQGTAYSQRFLILQQQNAFQQQQRAVENALQQTATLVLTVQRQVAMPLQTIPTTPLGFPQQQIALLAAEQQTRSLLQTTQGNPSARNAALGQLLTLQNVRQQSLLLQSALQSQNYVLTPIQFGRL